MHLLDNIPSTRREASNYFDIDTFDITGILHFALSEPYHAFKAFTPPPRYYLRFH